MPIHRILSFLLIPVFFFTTTTNCIAQNADQKTVMLILGSANPATLKKRVNVAVRLYYSTIQFDRIIVSGGCGAHSSSICEASRMDSLLVLHGVPTNKIFEEEKSKSTKQNYCYSKELKHSGHQLISSNNHLYVVSSHWHAIPVAACFRAAGVKNAKYHIEGAVNPYGPTDYTHIFRDCRQPNYCKAILWPHIDATYYNPTTHKTFYFIDNIYYRLTPGKGVDPGFPKKIRQYPGWPKNWNKYVDAAWYNYQTHRIYLVQGTEVASISPKVTQHKKYTDQITHYFHQWPKNWGKGFVDAAFYNPNKDELTLFKNSTYVHFSNQTMNSRSPQKVNDSFKIDLPFQWGSGDLDAAYYNSTIDSITLYRGTDYLRYSSVSGSFKAKFPQHTPLPWPTKLWEVKPRTN